MKPKLIDNYYQICNADELYWFADFVNQGGYCVSANAVLTANITINENLLARLVKNNDENVTNGDDFKAWFPIGYYNSDVDCVDYAGIFDGNGHTISGLYFDKADQSCVGLFGIIGEDAIVKNVGVIDSYFSGYNEVGGVCGYNNGGTIENCYNSGEVSSGNSIGGVCGYNDEGTITNCYVLEKELKNTNKLRELCNELCEQYERKNHDYGNSFEQSLNEFGLVAGVCRIGDKYNRIKQLIKGSEQQVKDEAIEDTLMDMATYALMVVMWLDKEKT